jgi:hypothetical protein
MEQLVFQQLDEFMHCERKYGAQDEGEKRDGEQETGA